MGTPHSSSGASQNMHPVANGLKRSESGAEFTQHSAAGSHRRPLNIIN